MRDFALGLLVLVVGYQTTERARLSPSARAELEAAHLSWFEGIKAEDGDALDLLLSDDMTFHGPGGGAGTKGDFIKALRSGKLFYDSVEVFEQPQVRFHGNTAIVTGPVDILYRREDKPCLEWLRYTAVYGWTAAGWRLLAWQSTYRPDSPCRN